MTFIVGEPIDARAVLREEGVTDHEAPDRNALDRAAHRVRHVMQAELDRHVRAHGDRPYDGRSLMASLRRARGKLASVLPTGWPIAFLRNERNRTRGPARNRVHAILRDFDLLAFYLPFGWPLLSLARTFRRPPYGYRGMSAAQKQEVQGTFIWHLSERPLPPRDGTAPPIPDLTD
jgi:hypothetical protein